MLSFGTRKQASETMPMLQALMKMESHIGERRGTKVWDKTQATVVDVMKKTLGIMVRHSQLY